jgi:hypothetical protein
MKGCAIISSNEGLLVGSKFKIVVIKCLADSEILILSGKQY